MMNTARTKETECNRNVARSSVMYKGMYRTSVPIYIKLFVCIELYKT